MPALVPDPADGQGNGRDTEPKKDINILTYIVTSGIFAHGRDTSRDRTRHSPRVCLCVPQTLRAVSRQVQRSSEVCWISINFSERLTLKILLDEITLETYDRPGSKKYFAKLFIGLCS